MLVLISNITDNRLDGARFVPPTLGLPQFWVAKKGGYVTQFFDAILHRLLSIVNFDLQSVLPNFKWNCQAMRNTFFAMFFCLFYFISINAVDILNAINPWIAKKYIILKQFLNIQKFKNIKSRIFLVMVKSILGYY